jgi:DNA modification methylase
VTPHYADDWLTLYGGDCHEVLASLLADSVDCVVTSPPYWGLRDYGTATWEGGDAECDHKGGRFERPGLSSKQASNHGSGGDEASHECRKCGATRIDSQLGLERTPEEYVTNMVAVFREVRRVLKPSGTCWLNLGDSYASHDPGGFRPGEHLNSRAGREGGRNRAGVYGRHIGFKPKNLVGIPWRVAFALQADGWYLRSDIIWSKPNPMPESVTDRPTKSHEYLFLLTKSSRYFFDADAVREQQVSDYPSGNGFKRDARLSYRDDNGARGNDEQWQPSPAGRNIRSVWTIATRPYPGAHFAVFPPELPERCIKAGSSEKGVCPECGAPWERVVEVERSYESNAGKAARRSGVVTLGEGVPDRNDTTRAAGDIRLGPTVRTTTTGWRQTCDHNSPPVSAVILDPFGGSGTVGMVANRLSRRAILIDLNPEYLRQQMIRNAQTPMGI